MNKVLEEDPTAYDYDAVYDKMAERKANLLAAKATKADKKVYTFQKEFSQAVHLACLKTKGGSHIWIFKVLVLY
jgi:hypothetical protein